MTDWKNLLLVPRFRALWVALVCVNLGSWCLLVALPVLVAFRFGAGTALVVSLAWRIAPKILLAPASGVMLRRYGAPRVVGVALVAEGAVVAGLPWCQDFTILQLLVACIGALDVFVMPGLLSMRSVVTPKGFELAANALCSMADRIGKTIGPALGGLAISVGFEPAFLGFGLVTALASCLVARLPRIVRPASAAGGSFQRMPLEFWTMLRGDPALTGLLICAVSYMVLMGGLRPFLFWANRDWFGAADSAWTGLMVAQGLGAVAGALIAATFNRALLRHMSAFSLTMVTGMMEGVLDLALLLCPGGDTGAWVAMAILGLAGIPEVISTAAWFTAMQQRLPPERQAVFFAFSAPLWDCAFAMGVMSASLHTVGLLGLGPWWALLALTATLPLLPLLMLDARRVRKNVRALP